MKKIGLCLMCAVFVLFLQPVEAAKKEVPKSLSGVIVISETEAVKMLVDNKCLNPSSGRKCIFVDPRKKKDLKRGIVKGSVLYMLKKKKDFKKDKFFASLQKKGYSFNDYEDLKNIDIISGCNGKFCPRSGNLLSALIEDIGADFVKASNMKLYWVRDEGVPGILKLMR